MTIPRFLITAGEPSGIGPDLIVEMAQQSWQMELVVVACPDLLQARAEQLGLRLSVESWQPEAPASPSLPGRLKVMPVPLYHACVPGELNIENAPYVLDTLDVAVNHIMAGHADALVTGPVHKAILAQATGDFTGHTEYFARKTQTERTVMMLANEEMRVALATTHLPLRQVADAITHDLITSCISIVHHDLKHRFAVHQPRILVAGLNPHAGESGHLGREEIEIIEPALASLRARGIDVSPPLPADTLFTPARLMQSDCVVAMYHDQGLPVIKASGFGETVNITLGLPFVRVSVDHGTALELAGTGKARFDSLYSALLAASRLHISARRVLEN